MSRDASIHLKKIVTSKKNFKAKNFENEKKLEDTKSVEGLETWRAQLFKFINLVPGIDENHQNIEKICKLN